MPAAGDAVEVTVSDKPLQGGPVGDAPKLTPGSDPPTLGEQAAHRGVGLEIRHSPSLPRIRNRPPTLSTGRRSDPQRAVGWGSVAMNTVV